MGAKGPPTREGRHITPSRHQAVQRNSPGDRSPMRHFAQIDAASGVRIHPLISARKISSTLLRRLELSRRHRWPCSSRGARQGAGVAPPGLGMRQTRVATRGYLAALGDECGRRATADPGEDHGCHHHPQARVAGRRGRRRRGLDEDRAPLHRRGLTRRPVPRAQDLADQGRLSRAVHRRPAGGRVAGPRADQPAGHAA